MYVHKDRLPVGRTPEVPVKRLALLTTLALLLNGPAALACVGKTLVIGAQETPEGRVVAQVIAILINERTGTTVKVAEFPDAEALHRSLASGEADIAVEFTADALARLGLEIPQNRDSAYQSAKAAYLERLNLVWLPRLGFGALTPPSGEAAPVARKETLKKFPALPRLIAKTEGILSQEVLQGLASAGEPARAARDFLRDRRLI